MNIFKLFKRNKTHPRQDLPVTPTMMFNVLGSSLSELWDSMVEGQHLAVKVFLEFKSFKRELDVKYSTLDFDRHISEIKIDEVSYELKATHCMYLYMLDLDNDTHISFDNGDGVTILSFSDYITITSRLTLIEQSYCDELSAYLNSNILPLVQKTDMTMFGINLCERTVPLNSLELSNYHRYIATNHYLYGTSDQPNWNRIANAPFLVERNDNSNPLLITDMKSVSAFVLDYLCYATIAIPSHDLDAVLLYRRENEESIKDMIGKRYGQEMVDCIDNALNDMNGSMFRTSVFKGLFLE